MFGSFRKPDMPQEEEEEKDTSSYAIKGCEVMAVAGVA